MVKFDKELTEVQVFVMLVRIRPAVKGMQKNFLSIDLYYYIFVS